ncbi:6-methylsalicylic acid synthase [Pleomassaria siparia CBS 279.74]|uniref:6-methylsalicylic acid synthase n=1 Tax=Pleomassaria siparia CBS 279.74 TaxID=1314801 RepID=A0A6G1K1F2_9PLEO|nr:6-methylsalicylic acid synthase [Pleomassaria siparia CBS 279.74]
MAKSEDSSNPSSVTMDFEFINPASPAKNPPHPEDIAIVGMSCRTAGGNNTPEKLWKFLMDKKNASGELPKKRWEPWLRRDPRNVKILEATTSKGYFIEDLENFDAAFFGISPKEAELMDPHQRLALELSWEALENAGIDPKSLAGSDTAVFMGVDSDDYSRLILEDLPNIEAWSGIGTAYHGIPNRISYHLDLMGPSTAVDAACASSLIAVHFGRQAILALESEVALVGGVNVLCAPALTHMLNKAGALSPDGKCISFDDNAHGYGRGEGGAIIVLKRLSSAIADNDNILSVLKGSATAQDGKTNGIMAPNSRAQEMVARQVLSRAGNMDPLTIGYVEAHATSTSLGDPTEVGAIANVYGLGRRENSPCAIGSIKPNVGHLEAAAGAIGFVKAVLAVHKNELAPQALLKKLNTRVDWKKSGLEVVQKCSPWPVTGSLRRAAICSYGYGGSVSHAVIEQTPPVHINRQNEEEERLQSDGLVSLVLSASQEKRLAIQASSLAAWLSAGGKTSTLRGICSTLAQRRAQHDYRTSFIVGSHEEAINALTDFAKGATIDYMANTRVLPADVRKDVVWVFSGHGAQWPNMGKELLKDAIFYQALTIVDKVIHDEAGFSAIAALESGDIGGSDTIQILTYVVQFGLSQVLKSKGIEPQAIIGHSVGEIAASVVAGCLTPEEGAIIVTRRATLYSRVKGLGGMALVNLPFSQVCGELEGRRDIVAAIYPSPSSCVISGEIAALNDYVASLAVRNIKTFRVNTDIPFHSPMLEQFVGPLSEVLASSLDPRPATIPLYSTSNSNPSTEVLRDTEYWINNMVSPVYLHRAVEAALDDGLRIFLEVSTHPIVTHSINDTIAARDLSGSATIGVMKKDSPVERSILHAVSQLHTLGATVNFRKQLGTRHWDRSVPGTPWVHKPFWKEVETAPLSAATLHDVDKHSLLGQRIDISGMDECLFTTTLDDKNKPYPLTHPLDGTEIIPAAVYCNTFRSATGASILSDLQLRVPVPMTADCRSVQVVVQGDSIRLSSRLQSSPTSSELVEHSWIDHSSSTWKKTDMNDLRQTFDIPSIKKRIGTLLPNSFAWDFLQKIGVSGIAFPWSVLEHIGNSKEMIVKVDMDPDSTAITWDVQSWAPFLDAATSIGSSVFFNDPKMRIVSQIDQVSFVSSDAPPKTGYLYIEEANDQKGLAAHISILSEKGDMLAKLHSMRFSDVEGVSETSSGIDGLVHEMVWIPPRFSEQPLALENVVLLSLDEGVLSRFSKELSPLVNDLVEITSVQELGEHKVFEVLKKKGSVVVYVPTCVESFQDVPEKAHAFTWEVVNILKSLATLSTPPKLYVVTDGVHEGSTPTALAQAPLHGFGRIAAQEHPDIWGALIDNQGPNFPLLAIRYVQEQDVIRMQDGLPRVARLRGLPRGQRYSTESERTLLPKPEGTYVITGGLGDLGLEVCDFLVKKGARRLVIISRRALPARNTWHMSQGTMKKVIETIQRLERRGATIHTISLDIGAPDAHSQLLSSFDSLSLPPVLGVVHAAGVSEDGVITNTTSASFSRVFSPKVSGALALHYAFPPNTVEFFVLFSSIGQLVGTSGQAPYGAANAFLDTLAVHRRRQGDNAVAFQWTAWRDMGLAAGSEFLAMDLASKGITDITCEEAFQAWEHVGKFDIALSVVTRACALDANEPAPIPLVEEICPRRAVQTALSTSTSPAPPVQTKPTTGPELKAWFTEQIKNCISAVLHLDVEEIDTRAAVVDLGVDSVMMIALRQQFQKVLGHKVPPTLTWSCPTVGHLAEWFLVKESG